MTPIRVASLLGLLFLPLASTAPVNHGRNLQVAKGKGPGKTEEAMVSVDKCISFAMNSGLAESELAMMRALLMMPDDDMGRVARPADKPGRPTDDPGRPERPCCEAMNAACLACAAGVTPAAYCKEYPETEGCKPREPCCLALTAECLACAAGVPPAIYCRRYPETQGCKDDPTGPTEPTRPRPEDPTGTRPEDPTGSRPPPPSPPSPPPTEDPTGTRPEDPTGSRPEDPTGSRPEDPTGPAGDKYAVPTAGVAIINGGLEEPSQLYCLKPADAELTSLPPSVAYRGRPPIAPQCCGKDNGKCYREVGGRCIARRSTSAAPHITPFTYSEAAEFCDKQGLELCRKTCKNTGCIYNAHPVYSSMPCDGRMRSLNEAGGEDGERYDDEA